MPARTPMTAAIEKADGPGDLVEPVRVQGNTHLIAKRNLHGGKPRLRDTEGIYENESEGDNADYEACKDFTGEDFHKNPFVGYFLKEQPIDIQVQYLRENQHSNDNQTDNQ